MSSSNPDLADTLNGEESFMHQDEHEVDPEDHGGQQNFHAIKPWKKNNGQAQLAGESSRFSRPHGHDLGGGSA